MASLDYQSLMNDVLLYFHVSMRGLAMKLMEVLKEKYLTPEKPGIRYRSVRLMDDIKWEKFSDGWPKLFINNVDKVKGRDVLFLASFHTPDAMFEQLSILYSMPKYLANSFVVILPLFTTGTMERIDKEGQIATAKVLASLLSAIPLTTRGPPQIVIFDIHALQERFYFSDNVIPRLETAIPLLNQVLSSRADRGKISIAFPDEGALKRFGHQLIDWPIITCTKVREGNHRIVTVTEGDPTGRHVVIVDDLVMTGGTLIECSKGLLKNGAVTISLYVTHAIFPNDSWKRFLPDKCEIKFDNFWITDSLPTSDDIAKHPPFRILSLSERIAESLLSYDLRF
ncbi:Ribose-phosphate pyrophosphokinase 4-like [Oopsacas minuta]|uniref:Ribose-phosphate pyrophosphokinase 4-like n=1 Tax=Oopsacas minuta TaxID=111878 RepID=A0AAV7JI01_9METZ|nr:Ribose-phosphate pyrophosphokinase 4-like [Oopsacas minuta]